MAFAAPAPRLPQRPGTPALRSVGRMVPAEHWQEAGSRACDRNVDFAVLRELKNERVSPGSMEGRGENIFLNVKSEATLPLQVDSESNARQICEVTFQLFPGLTLQRKPRVRPETGFGDPDCDVRNSCYRNNNREAASGQAGFAFLSCRGLSGRAKCPNHFISPFVIHCAGGESNYFQISVSVFFSVSL